ncbi:ABC transporter substrate-binding protein [Dethiosulfatarculus sandiegensis]|uniref:ABC transporter substrate-binding protein n=1 Tax=Dethiosulfatarculus sandiegensis TaxID=1429043 RepID=UPI000698531D|nr:ABC transporter substrate-binding protein [Dethiosulfatarculus sandiegensis]
MTCCLKKSILMLCALSFLMAPAYALAGDDVLAKVKKSGKLIVGTSADYPPYEAVDADNKFVGFDMDLIREVAKRMGIKVEIKDMGFDSLITALQAKKIDAVIAAMQATPARKKKVDFSTVYHKIKDAFLVKKGSKIKLNSPHDAAPYKVASQTGTIQEKWVKTNLIDTGKMDKDRYFSYERVDNAAMDVANGRVEVLFIIADPAKKLAQKAGLDIALVTGETVGGGQSIALPKGADALKAEIDKAIESIKADGTLKKLMDKWELQ